MRRGVLVLVVLLAAGGGWWFLQPRALASEAAWAGSAADAFTRRQSGLQLRITGTVLRILADDNDQSPHQRFIIKANDGTTLLVAHNLELAPRLAGLAAGDQLVVAGEYQWNAQGGLIHWTHDDPHGAHPSGYIEWRGRRYQ